MFFIFFFQAEDGIRDLYVTGVQTCALPISLGLDIRIFSLRRPTDTKRHAVHGEINAAVSYLPEYLYQEPLRSEERRVGKECRSRWLADYLKKKKTTVYGSWSCWYVWHRWES